MSTALIFNPNHRKANSLKHSEAFACKALKYSSKVAGTLRIPKYSKNTEWTIFGRRERRLKHKSIFLNRELNPIGLEEEAEEWDEVTTKANFTPRSTGEERGLFGLKCRSQISWKLRLAQLDCISYQATLGKERPWMGNRLWTLVAVHMGLNLNGSHLGLIFNGSR